MMTRSTYLLSRPRFRRGAARLVDLGGVLNDSAYRISESPEESDALALYSDWLAVGDDLANAISTVVEAPDRKTEGKKRPKKSVSRSPARPEQKPAPPTVGQDRRGGLLFRAEFVGPVPPPEMMQRYEDVYPGAAALIFGAWDTQAAHRRGIEERVIAADIRAEWRGLHLAFLLAAITVIGGIVLIALGKDLYGLAAVMAPLAILAGVFFQSKREQRQELKAKTPGDPDEPRRLPAPRK